MFIFYSLLRERDPLIHSRTQIEDVTKRLTEKALLDQIKDACVSTRAKYFQ